MLTDGGIYKIVNDAMNIVITQHDLYTTGRYGMSHILGTYLWTSVFSS